MTPREVAEFWQPVFGDGLMYEIRYIRPVEGEPYFKRLDPEKADLVLQAHAGRMLAEAEQCVVRDDDGDWWAMKTATGVDWSLPNATDYRTALRDAAAMLVQSRNGSSEIVTDGSEKTSTEKTP